MEIRCTQKEKDYRIYETSFFIHLMITTHRTPKAESHNLKREETEGRGMEYHQTETTVRNTEEKNQWRNIATRKQKIKWL